MGSTAGLSMQAAGVGASVAGAYASSSATKDAYAIQADVARQNAAYAELQAKDAVRRGMEIEAQGRLKAGQLKSTQRARFAASGVDVNVGSAAAVMADTDILADIDAATVRENAQREVAGFIRQRNNAIMEGGMLAGRSAAESPMGAAASTLLTGGGQLASSWYRLNKESGDSGRGTPNGTGGGTTKKASNWIG